MATPEIILAAPTRLEAWAVRRAAKPLRRRATVQRTGIGLREWRPGPGSSVILCGLAGALSDRLARGAVVIPSTVSLPSGPARECDSHLMNALVEAARGGGFEPATGALLTAPEMVTGARRLAWASQFAAADMEAALLPADMRFAVVRVILDAPTHDISDSWSRPAKVLVRPWLWPQAVRLALTAPRYALRAGRIAAAAYALLSDP